MEEPRQETAGRRRPGSGRVAAVGSRRPAPGQRKASGVREVSAGYGLPEKRFCLRPREQPEKDRGPLANLERRPCLSGSWWGARVGRVWGLHGVEPVRRPGGTNTDAF